MKTKHNRLFVCFPTFSCENVAFWWGFSRVPPHFCWFSAAFVRVSPHVRVKAYSWFIVDSSATFWHRTCSKNALVEHARPWCLGPAKNQFSAAFVCFATFSCKNVAFWWGFFHVPPHFAAQGRFSAAFVRVRHMLVWKLAKHARKTPRLNTPGHGVFRCFCVLPHFRVKI